MESSPHTTTIIVNYNAGPLLLQASDSALHANASTAPPATRVIVVDNASSDSSALHCALQFSNNPRFTLISNATNLGFAAACNIGAKAAMAANSGHEANQILFLNPDCTLEPQALWHLTHALHSASDVGMVGGFLCNLDGSEQEGGRRTFPTPKQAFIRAFGLHKLAKWFPALKQDFSLRNQPLPSKPVPVQAISGACMLVKREAIESVGLWDEGYFLHCKDLDWCMRFQQAGWKILFVPQAKVPHHKGACSRSRPVFVEWNKHKGMLRFYRKFYRPKYSRALWAAVVMGVWLRFSLLAGYHTVRNLQQAMKGKPNV